MMNDLNPEALEHVAQGVGGRKDVANNIVTWLRLAKAYRQDVKIKATDPRTGKMAVFQVKDGEITSKPPTIELEPDMASETPMALRAIR